MSEKIAEQPIELERENRRNLRRLVLSMQASLGKLSLLIGICDNFNYRDTLVQTYETELQAKGVVCYRVRLDHDRPSLKQALLDLWEQTPEVQSDSPKIVTVLGADELLGIPLNEAKSAQEKFFFSVQWTRESLRQFQLPVVIWVTEKIATGLAQQAPDFWSWRGGVFEFRQPIVYPSKEPQPSLSRLDESSSAETLANPDEIVQQIEALLAEDPTSPLLGSLYSSLGQTYYNRLEQGLAEDYPKEQQQAIAAFQNASDRAKAAHDDIKLARDLSYLALLYKQMGRYKQAEPLLLQALELYKRRLGDNHPYVATILSNLALLYNAQGRYKEAEPLYLQALELYKRLPRDNHPDVANSLNNLALLYNAQGRYNEAELLYLQALELRKYLLGDNHPDVANSLHNLAGFYIDQGRYNEAEPLFLQALEILEKTLGSNHPNTVTCRENLESLRSELVQHTDKGEFTF